MQKAARGFTLIELLIVIAIIVVFAAIVLGLIVEGKQKGRDARRLVDLRTFGTALELYRGESGHYPVSLTWITDCGTAGPNWISDSGNFDWSAPYISSMPRDPAQNCNDPLSQHSYQYWSDGESFKISAELEKAPPPGSQNIVFDGSVITQTPNPPLVATLNSSTGNPTNQAPIPFTVTFSRAVVDFVQGSLAVTRGVVSGFSAVSGLVYNFFITPTDNDTITVLLSANTVHDQGGTGNQAAEYSITYDSLQPHVALSPDPLPPQVNGAFTVTVNTTIAVTDFSAGSVSVSNGTVSGAGPVGPLNGQNYSFVVTPTAPGEVFVSIHAGVLHSQAGNNNVISNEISTTYAP